MQWSWNPNLLLLFFIFHPKQQNQCSQCHFPRFRWTFPFHSPFFFCKKKCRAFMPVHRFIRIPNLDKVIDILVAYTANKHRKKLCIIKRKILGFDPLRGSRDTRGHAVAVEPKQLCNYDKGNEPREINNVTFFQSPCACAANALSAGLSPGSKKRLEAQAKIGTLLVLCDAAGIG